MKNLVCMFTIYFLRSEANMMVILSSGANGQQPIAGMNLVVVTCGAMLAPPIFVSPPPTLSPTHAPM